MRTALMVLAFAGSATATAMSTTGLVADRSNLKSGKPSERFAIGENGKHPTFMWVPGHTENGERQAAYQLRVFQSHDQHGQSADVAVWDSGVVLSELPVAEYAGPQLEGRTYYSWQVQWRDSKNLSSGWSAPAEFHFSPTAAQTANPVWVKGSTDAINLYRTSFTLPADAVRVTLYACGLGYSHASVNGKAASPQELTTAPWSNNERRNAYSVLDITALAVAGKPNVLGVALGGGYRNQSLWARKDANENGFDMALLTLWAQVHVVTKSGTDTVIVDTASGAWTGAAGPLVFSDVYNGETYDATKEIEGWDTVELVEKASDGWEPIAVNADAPHGSVAPWMGPPVMLDRVVKPVNITEPHPGVFVVDFGVNLAGVCKLSNIKLARGASVTLRHGEILQHAGLPDLGKNVDPTMPYYGNLRSARATDVYVAKGDAAGETFYPSFTYHGFRFVEVRGLAALATGDIELHHFHSAVEPKGAVTFKSPVLTRIYAMAAGSQRSNMMTVQSDCDQRDERLGWMGDANLSGDSMVLNFKYGAFLMSFFRVMLDELNPDGSSVDVAPNVRYGGRPADISWGTATIAFPYAAWKGDGDLGPAKASMAGLVAHVGNIGTQCKGVAGVTCPTKYGDWVPPNPPGKGQGPKPTKPFTSAFSYVDAAQKVAELARAVGNTTLADQLDALHAKLGDDFNAAFAKNGTYDNGVMTTFTLPLHLGIVPAAAKAAVQKNLLDMVATTYKDHNMCGIIGMKFLFEQLAAMGREDTALAVLESTSYPSIGFMAYNTYEDATENLWELWDAYTEGVGMNSRNHHMFSSYSKYLVEHVAGLSHSPGLDGRRTIRFGPAADLGVSSATVRSMLDHGEVSLDWERAGGLQCAKAPAGEVAELSCGRGGGVVKAVRFASWGTPFGSCGSFGADDRCAVSAVRLVERRCLGRANCTVPAAAELLGAAANCAGLSNGELPRLFVEVECDGAQAIHASAKVPLASDATIKIPTAGISAPVLVSGTGAVYSTAAITDGNNRAYVTAALGSGVHELTLKAGQVPTSVGPVQIADGAVVGSALQLACPANLRASRVRFASYGNPHQASDGTRTRGACHVGSVISDAEVACLGKQACTVAVDHHRLVGLATCVTELSVLAVQLECTA